MYVWYVYIHVFSMWVHACVLCAFMFMCTFVMACMLCMPTVRVCTCVYTGMSICMHGQVCAHTLCACGVCAYSVYVLVCYMHIWYVHALWLYVYVCVLVCICACELWSQKQCEFRHLLWQLALPSWTSQCFDTVWNRIFIAWILLIAQTTFF